MNRVQPKLLEVSHMFAGLTADDLKKVPKIGLLKETVERVAADVDRACAEYELQLALTETVAKEVTLSGVMNRVYAEFKRMIPYDRIGVALLDESGRTLVATWARTTAAEVHLREGYSLPLRETSLGQVMARGKPRVLNDLADYLEQHPQSDATRRIVREGMLSSLTCPLEGEQGALGLLFFSSKKRGTYESAHVGFFARIAVQVSLAVEKGLLYDRLLDLRAGQNRFLGMAAHDLRSPLTTIRGFVGLFQEELLGHVTSEGRNALARMERGCDKMLALINDLLDVSVIESGRLTLSLGDVDPALLATECVESFHALGARKGVSVEMRQEGGLRSFRADARRVSQILDNLVSNAVKYSPVNTSVTVSVRARADSVEFEVSDQGPGIPEADRQRIFGDFQRTDAKPTGGESSTGLGLAIVRRLVEAHTGKIKVVSALGIGSRFLVELPFDGPTTTDSRTFLRSEIGLGA